MNINRPLVPRFLKTAEQKLLLNKPGIWSTRAHLVLYYGLLFILFLAALCFLDATDIRSRSTAEYWVEFICIISIIGLTVWLMYLLRFNLFKKHGTLHPLHALSTFILFFISTGIIVLFTYVPPVVESVRANLAYDDEEIVQDVNAINVKICQLEYHLLNKPWKFDTVAIVKDKEPSSRTPYYEEETYIIADTVVGKSAYPYRRLDSTAFANRLNNTDSIVKINDTLYVLYNTPHYVFINAGIADNTTKTKLLTSFDIHKKVFRYPAPDAAARPAISKELSLLLNKYLIQNDFNSTAQGIETDDGYAAIYLKYHLYTVNNNINHIVRKKYRWAETHMPEYVRIFYYVTLTITLLVFIFRHSTVRTFFLSLLTALLLTIFTAFVFTFSRFDDEAFFIWLIGYAVMFFVGSLSTLYSKKRKITTGICINLFVFLVPVIPLFFVGGYFSWLRHRNRFLYEPVALPDIDLYVFYSEVVGALLLLVLLGTYISKVYRRWYSLPED